MTGEPRDRPDVVLSAIRQERMVAIVRAARASLAAQAAGTLLDAGVRVLEVSMTTPGALDVVAELVRRTSARPEVSIGVGTVLSADAVREAARRGARFVISPVLDDEVVSAARDRGLAAIPGCATPTEMLRAIRLGATAVKIFPASTWTPGALGDLLTALPHLPCVPTGGIALNDVPAWLAAGAIAVGLGSTLTQGDATTVRNRLERLRHAIAGGPPEQPPEAATGRS